MHVPQPFVASEVELLEQKLFQAFCVWLARTDLGTHCYSERANYAVSATNKFLVIQIQQICSRQPLCKLRLEGAVLLTTS